MVAEDDRSSLEESRACSSLELAAAALQRDAAGQRSIERNCANDIAEFASKEQVIAEAERRQKLRLAPLPGFTLSGRAGDSTYVRSTMSDLEVTVGRKLDFVHLDDDKAGHAHVYILNPSPAQESVAVRQQSCANPGDWPDVELNYLLRLPVGTSANEAEAIRNQRERAAQLLLKGIDPDLPDDQVNAIEQRRQAEVNAIRQEQDASVNSRLIDQLNAINVGLPPQSSFEYFLEATEDYKRRAEAVRLGLPRMAGAEEIKAAQDEIERNLNSYVDVHLNHALGLSPGTRHEEARRFEMERLKKTAFAEIGINPELPAEERDAIYEARQARCKVLFTQYEVTENEADRRVLLRKVDAVQFGLPEDSDKATIESTRKLYLQQAEAVKHGLPVSASLVEIDAARQHLLLTAPVPFCAPDSSAKKTSVDAKVFSNDDE